MGLPSEPMTIRGPPGGEGCSEARDNQPPACCDPIGTREGRRAYYKQQVEDLGDGWTGVYYRRITGLFTRVCESNAIGSAFAAS